MKQNYFVHNGKRYDTGTMIVLSRFDYISRKVCNIKSTFLYYNTDTKEYIVEIYGKEYVYTETDFYNDFLHVYEKNKPIANMQNQANVKHTFSDELGIDGLLIAWIWYIFIMAVGIIFYDRIGIWILASIIFFDYRNKKLKEAGYK